MSTKETIKEFVTGELRSVIQWEDPQDTDLFYQWTDSGEELKNASKLIINPGQGCIVVYEGKVQATMTEPGMHNLQTDNIPFITTLRKTIALMEGSEHLVGIHFFRTGNIVNQKYGTPAPIVYQDPIYNFPVGLRAFGNYSLQITSPQEFFEKIVMSAQGYRVEQIQVAINARMSQPFADFLAHSKYSYAEIDSNRITIAEELYKKIESIFQELGFAITDFRIEGTSFDQETQARIAKISDVAADVHAAQIAGVEFSELQKLHALRDAAKNEGGTAGVGAGIGAGMAMSNMMMSTPEKPSDETAKDPVVHLEKLKEMLEKELITEEEYTAKKRTILENL